MTVSPVATSRKPGSALSKVLASQSWHPVGETDKQNTHGRVQGVVTEAKVLVLPPPGKRPVS